MTIGIIESILNTRADAITAGVDAGLAAASLIIYSGTRPATPATAIGAQVALATFTLPDPVAPVAVGGVATWNAITAVTTSATGTATWFRVVTSAPTNVFDGDVGVTGSGLDIELDSVSIITGRLISLDSFVITEVNT